MSEAKVVKTADQHVCAIGRFAGLDEQQEYDPKVIESLNAWAHTVKEEKDIRKQKKTSLRAPDKIDRTVNYVNSNQKPDNGNIVVVQTDKDVNKALDVIAALPQDKKGIAKAYKKVSEVELQEDEILAMIDSGSFEHAADAEAELPDHPVIPPPTHAQEAETACGGILKNLGSVKVEAEADGHTIGINFVNMKVKCPILSVRKICRDGHEVRIHRRGGVIRNNGNGKEIKFFEHRGVYYVKLKIKKPVPVPEAGFTRQGA